MDKDIQQRMKSIRQTVQISNAQKLMAASNIGKARRLLAETRPYHERIRQSISEVLVRVPENSNPYLTEDAPVSGRRGLLVLSANKGLAGGYNSNVLRLVEKSLERAPAKHVIVLGNAGRTHMMASGRKFDVSYDIPIDPPSLFTARELAEDISDMFDKGEVDSFDIIYTNYGSMVRLTPVEEPLFPLHPSVFGEPERDLQDVVFEPSADDVLSTLILKYLKGFIYGCLVHAWTCELASRITAMDSAIRNGTEMLEELSLAYNRARQAAITQEITEIVAGASSMQNDN